MTDPRTSFMAHEMSSHDHGNCELCDAIEKQLAETQAALDRE